MTPLVEARALAAGYSGNPVVRALNLVVNPGEIVALLGANGAGKTTTLLTLAGELKPVLGDVYWLGQPASGALYRRARQGLALVTEERSVFSKLSTRQNLLLARGGLPGGGTTVFPELEALADRRAGLLSGGEQQMLTLGRAIAREPKLLLADELSLGLAPRTVTRLLDAVRSAADRGMGALLVEQHVHRVLNIADRVYVLRRGVLEFTGSAQEAREQLDEIQASYLGANSSSTKTHSA